MCTGKRERVRETVEKGRKKDNRTKLEPDTFFVKAIMVAVDIFVVASSVSNSFFSYFFRYINDLDYCVMTQRDRLNMAKINAKRKVFWGREQSDRQFVFVRNSTTLHKSSARSRISDAPHAKISPVQISAGIRKSVHFTPKFYNFLFYFLPSVWKMNFFGRRKNINEQYKTHTSLQRYTVHKTESILTKHTTKYKRSDGAFECFGELARSNKM